MAVTMPKIYSDVNWKVILKNLPTAQDVTPLVILTSINKDGYHEFSNSSDLAEVYNENTSVYPIANAVLNATNYDLPVGILDTDSAQKPDVPAINGASASPTMISGFVDAVRAIVYNGFTFLVPDKAAVTNSDDINQLIDFAYQSQKFELMLQINSVQEAQQYYNHVAALPEDKNKFPNTTAIFDNTGHYPAANAAAFVAANKPAELSHIPNESEFYIPTLNPADAKAFDDLNVGHVVNKAGDLMLTSGKSLGGDWMDHFVNFKTIIDAFTFAVQKYHNDNKWPVMDDLHMNELKVKLIAVDNDLHTQGFTQDTSDINFKPVSQISNTNKIARRYNGLNIGTKLADPFNTVDGTLTITL